MSYDFHKTSENFAELCKNTTTGDKGFFLKKNQTTHVFEWKKPKLVKWKKWSQL